MARFEDLDKLLRDIQEGGSGSPEVDSALDMPMEPQNIVPFASPMDAQMSEPEVELAQASPVVPEVVQDKVAETVKKDVSKLSTPKVDKKPMSDLEKIMSEYEARKQKGDMIDMIMKGGQSVMDALSQYDLAGGPQFSGLKAKTTKLPEFGLGAAADQDFARKSALLKAEEDRAAKLRKEKREEEKLDIMKQKADKKTEGITKGQEARDKEFGKEYAKFADAGGYANIKKNLTTLEDVVGKLEQTGSDLTGGYIEKFAPEAAADYYRAAFDEEAQDVKDKVEQVIQQSLRQTLGAQFTEKEATRLIERSFNTKLSPAKNAERLKATIAELDDMARTKEAAGRHLDQYGTLKGYEAPSAVSRAAKPSQPVKSGEVRRMTKDGRVAIFDAATKKFLRYE